MYNPNHKQKRPFIPNMCRWLKFGLAPIGYATVSTGSLVRVGLVCVSVGSAGVRVGSVGALNQRKAQTRMGLRSGEYRVKVSQSMYFDVITDATRVIKKIMMKKHFRMDTLTSEVNVMTPWQ